MKIFRILLAGTGAGAILLGMVFKTLHWFGAYDLIILGSLILIVFFALALISGVFMRKKEKKNASELTDKIDEIGE